jgi:multiple sugar transport system ATP-binding protein
VDVGAAEPVILRETGTSRHDIDAKVSIAPLAGKVHRFNAEGKAI